jgi:uncharacterized protein (DUF1499 family)
MKTKLSIILTFLFLIDCSGKRPENLGIKDQKLTPCPETPNCVTSFVDSSDTIHYISAIPYSASLDSEKDKIKKICANLPRTNLVKETNNYLYYEFTSFLMRYVDDVEFYLDEKSKLIHVRSASRIGKGDMGVNRKRIEAIRKELEKLK